jgi:hypothetical protein
VKTGMNAVPMMLAAEPTVLGVNGLGFAAPESRQHR